jgi:hypothetical protein
MSQKTVLFADIPFGHRFCHRRLGQVGAIYVRITGLMARCEVSDGGGSLRPGAIVNFENHEEVRELKDKFSPEQIGQYAHLTKDEAVETLKSIGDKLLKSGVGEVKVESDGADTFINIENWGIALRPDFYTTKSLLGDIAHGGWVIEASKVVNNYPHEPDDVDVESISKVLPVGQAVAEALKAIFAMQLDIQLENDGIGRFLQEEEEALIGGIQ